MLGLSNFPPRFVKKYAKLNKSIETSIRNYTKDVRKRKFPYNNNTYK